MADEQLAEFLRAAALSDDLDTDPDFSPAQSLFGFAQSANLSDVCLIPWTGLVEACGRGDLAAAEGLAEAHQLARTDSPRHCEQALLAACSGGHLEAALWLVDRFGEAGPDPRRDYRTRRMLLPAARATLANGTPTPMAEWLIEHYGLTFDELYGELVTD